MHRVLHCIAGLGAEGGGLVELVPMFALEAKRAGLEVGLASPMHAGQTLSPPTLDALSHGVDAHFFRPSHPYFFVFSWQMCFRLPHVIAQYDWVHVHGNWTFLVYWSCLWACLLGKPYVMSPQGSFDPVRLAYSAWKKKLVGWIDRFFLRRARLIHVTAPIEGDWAERFARCRLPLQIIPNGVSMPAHLSPPKPLSDERTILYIGRIHPLKGIDLLLEAWRSLAPANGRLIIAGPDAPNQVDISDLTNVSVLPGVFGQGKWELIQSCDYLVLPTRSENFGIVVAEALACGKPVICTQGAPWRDLLDGLDGAHRCGWWTPVSQAAIADALTEAINLPEATYRTYQSNGINLIRNRYQWQAVGRDLVKAYQQASTRNS